MLKLQIKNYEYFSFVDDQYEDNPSSFESIDVEIQHVK